MRDSKVIVTERATFVTCGNRAGLRACPAGDEACQESKAPEANGSFGFSVPLEE